MSVAVRFAPSPTGRLHVGNARVALVNWLFARKTGGQFILRIDDTDTERSRPHFTRAIIEDLQWLGLFWDRMEIQSERYDRYALAAERLKAAGRLYPCYETAEELEDKRKRQLARGKPPIYDRAALRLTDSEKAEFESQGRRPHWRFQLLHEDIGWVDLLHGPWHFDGSNLNDPILVRGDGQPLFGFCSAVDDIEFGITHVIRGEDHVTTTAAQIQITAALGASPPSFGHLPLLSDVSGEGLSKRIGSFSLGEMRGEGIEPMAINSYLARLGSADPIEPVGELSALTAAFDIGRLGKAGPRIDFAELKTLNHKVLAILPYAAVAERLAALGLAGADERFWLAVRGNIARLEDARYWYEVCRGDVRPVIDDPGFAAAAARLLPAGAWDEGTWGAWTSAVKGETGRSGKALFMPLRRALTGADHGPELKILLPLIGRERALARLGGKTA